MGSSKTLFVMLVALALHASATLALPVIHLINSVGPNSPPILFTYKVSNDAPKIQTELRPSQDYQIKVQRNDVYYLTAVFGLKVAGVYNYENKFASVHIYEPARDSGKPVVFWRADALGWSISYDNVQYKLVAVWKSG